MNAKPKLAADLADDPIPLLDGAQMMGVWLRINEMEPDARSEEEEELYARITKAMLWQFQFQDFREDEPEPGTEADRPERLVREEKPPAEEGTFPARESAKIMGTLNKAIEMLREQNTTIQTLGERLTLVEEHQTRG